jgi:hypothetical protein
MALSVLARSQRATPQAAVRSTRSNSKTGISTSVGSRKMLAEFSQVHPIERIKGLEPNKVPHFIEINSSNIYYSTLG